MLKCLPFNLFLLQLGTFTMGNPASKQGKAKDVVQEPTVESQPPERREVILVFSQQKIHRETVFV